jgi:hypothetical protein
VSGKSETTLSKGIDRRLVVFVIRDDERHRHAGIHEKVG